MELGPEMMELCLTLMMGCVFRTFMDFCVNYTQNCVQYMWELEQGYNVELVTMLGVIAL